MSEQRGRLTSGDPGADGGEWGQATGQVPVLHDRAVVTAGTTTAPVPVTAARIRCGVA